MTLDLTSTRVSGVLVFDPSLWEHGQDPRRRMAVAGLTYEGLPRVGADLDWLQLLRTATPAYVAQPYQQLAAAHRAAGHDGAARQVLMQQRQDQLDRRALTRKPDRAWARFTGLTLGYGYQPWRALLGLLVVLITSITLALGLGGHQGGLARPTPAAGPATVQPSAAAVANAPVTARPCSTLLQIGVGLDLGLPPLKAGATTDCKPTDTPAGQTLTVMSWLLQAPAWAFATLFIAGFTNAVRKT